MDGELWTQLYRQIRFVDSIHQQSPMKFRDAEIVATYYWSVLHDRPVYWACQMQNWPELLRPQRLPSQPTMSRRMKHHKGVRQFLRELEESLAQSVTLLGLMLIALLDGKPLPIGRHSKDPDADFGRGAGGSDKGYKLHALWHDAPIPIWEVRPMNIDERVMALRLVSHLETETYVLADKGYDGNRLHRHCAIHGVQLVAPQRYAHARGVGHRQQSPARLHALEMLKRPMGRDLSCLRRDIERRFGNLTSFGGGLAPLPAWVRRLSRVRQWVGAKLVINAVRILQVQSRLAA
jgi:IS5 family transposase